MINRKKENLKLSPIDQISWETEVKEGNVQDISGNSTRWQSAQGVPALEVEHLEPGHNGKATFHL